MVAPAIPVAYGLATLAARFGMPMAKELIKKYGPGVVDALAGTGIGAYISDKFIDWDQLEKEKEEYDKPIVTLPVKDETPQESFPIPSIEDMTGPLITYPVKDETPQESFPIEEDKFPSILTIESPSTKEVYSTKEWQPPVARSFETIRKERRSVEKEVEEENKKIFESYPGNVQNALFKRWGFKPEDKFNLGYQDMPVEMKYAILEGKMDIPTRYHEDFFQERFEDDIKTKLAVDFNNEFKPIVNKNGMIQSFERLPGTPSDYPFGHDAPKGYTALDGNTYTNPHVIKRMQELDEETRKKQFEEERKLFGKQESDYTRKQNFKNRYENEVYNIYKYGIKNEKGKYVVRPKIPNLVKGHEANRYKRLKLGETDLEQVTHPTFYTTEWRNNKHIILEKDHAVYKAELRDLTETSKSREENKERIQKINTAISLIEKDLETLLLPTSRLDKGTGKFRAYGKYASNPQELLKSLNTKKKLFYFGSKHDLKREQRKKSYKNIKFKKENIDGKKMHVAMVPEGFKYGGLIGIDQLTRPI